MLMTAVRQLAMVDGWLNAFNITVIEVDEAPRPPIRPLRFSTCTDLNTYVLAGFRHVPPRGLVCELAWKGVFRGREGCFGKKKNEGGREVEHMRARAINLARSPPRMVGVRPGMWWRIYTDPGQGLSITFRGDRCHWTLGGAVFAGTC